MKKSRGDVCWYVPKKKKPIAYSTVATKDSIVYLSNKGNKTIREIKEANWGLYSDIEEIMQKYIDAGYGDKTFLEIDEMIAERNVYGN